MKSYATTLREHDSRFAIVTDSDRVARQLELTGTAEQMGRERIYRSTAFVGESTRRAHDDAAIWIERQQEREASDAND
jgi:SulP family sulfate permease